MASKTRQQTGPQIVAYGTNPVMTFDGAIGNTVEPSGWPTTVREMRKDPTLAFIRTMLAAPILSTGWSYEEQGEPPEGAREFVEDELGKQRFELLRNSVNGCMDFGWQPFEKVMKVRRDGKIGFRKLKPMIQDVTEIRIDDLTGAYRGLKQDFVLLDPVSTLTVAWDVEGTNWYGHALMLNAKDPYNHWNDANDSAKRFDQRIAGAHWVVHYPVGKSMYEGAELDNGEIAKKILQSLEASGRISIPWNLDEMLPDSASKEAWKIEILSSDGKQSFTDRLKYLDALKARAMGFTERSVFEGQFGTKAEAGEHADFTITMMELRHQMITNQVNEYCVNPLLRFNYGEEAADTITVKPIPLQDETKKVLVKVYEKILSSPDAALEEFDNIDRESMRSQLGIPSSVEEEGDVDDDDKSLFED